MLRRTRVNLSVASVFLEVKRRKMLFKQFSTATNVIQSTIVKLYVRKLLASKSVSVIVQRYGARGTTITLIFLFTRQNNGIFGFSVHSPGTRILLLIEFNVWRFSCRKTVAISFCIIRQKRVGKQDASTSSCAQ